ncbi:MAG: hypothetical protein CM15mP49_22860 [Actinomycetota bacterium]|nr:MAG: hypothetical protein CM15mP49_22860 [Actinomycetota bacterium]
MHNELKWFKRFRSYGRYHHIDWEKADLHWLNPCEGTPTQQKQIEIYRSYVEKELAGREHPVMDYALDWLDHNNPNDERIGLSWGDARLGNIIWDNYTPAAVVDWEACSLCPTEADLGWWLMFDRMSFDDVDVERLSGYPTREEQAAYYAQVSGKKSVTRITGKCSQLCDSALSSYVSETDSQILGFSHPR